MQEILSSCGSFFQLPARELPISPSFSTEVTGDERSIRSISGIQNESRMPIGLLFSRGSLLAAASDI